MPPARVEHRAVCDHSDAVARLVRGVRVSEFFEVCHFSHIPQGLLVSPALSVIVAPFA